MITDISYEQMLVDGAKEVFETMIFMEIMPAEANVTSFEDHVLGSISFKGDIEGSLSICCSKQCATEISANMLGMDPHDDMSDEDITDAFGEVINMVMGSFKKRMLEYIKDLEVSIPNVVSGQHLKKVPGEGYIKEHTNISIEGHYVAEIILIMKESG